MLATPALGEGGQHLQPDRAVAERRLVRATVDCQPDTADQCGDIQRPILLVTLIAQIRKHRRQLCFEEDAPQLASRSSYLCELVLMQLGASAHCEACRRHAELD